MRTHRDMLESRVTARSESHVDDAGPNFGIRDVADFPSFDYSMKDVLRAGEALAGVVPWNNEQEAEHARLVFKIAQNFRDSHAYPMYRLRLELRGHIKASGVKAPSVARLKRMPSIRRKLRNNPGKLNQIQDLAGCRAVVPTIDDANAVIESLRRNSKHELFREYPYITAPKPDGYRCHHAVFKFRGVGEEEVYNGRRVEVQIRTALQHSWATAVEAVGLFRREDLKSGQGSPDWLRLFQLMSVELALEERCIVVDHATRAAGLAELKALTEKLEAVDILERLAQAFAYHEKYYFDPQNKPDYLKIIYDRAEGRVRIEPLFGARNAAQSYDFAETTIEASGSGETKVVLIEADDVENLMAAYPNYFGDVQNFKSKLRDLAGVRDTLDYSVPDQPLAPKPVRNYPFDKGRERI